MFRLDRFSAQYWWCNDALNNVLRLDVRWDGLSDFYSELSYKTEESDILAHRAIELVLLGHGLNTRSLFCTFFMEMLENCVLPLLLVLLLSWALRIILYFMLEQSTMRQEKGNFLYEKTSRSNVKLIGKIFCIFISLCLLCRERSGCLAEMWATIPARMR